MNNFLEEYCSEVGSIAIGILRGRSYSEREQHAAIESAVKQHEWMSDTRMHHEVLINTRNRNEVDEVGFASKDIHGVIKEAAYWAFYADVTDEIRDMKAEGLS